MAVKFHIHGEGRFNRGHAIGPCVWPNFDLFAVNSGHVRITLLDLEVVDLRRGQSILIYPRTQFFGETISHASVVFVQHFGLTEAERELGEQHPLGRLYGRSKGYELYALSGSRDVMRDIRRAVMLAHVAPVRTTHSIRESLLTLILAQLSAHRTSKAYTPHLAGLQADFAQVVQWIAANLHRQLTLEEVSEQAGYSSSHFRATFKQHLGQSLGVFIRQCRHLEAARLLRETNQPIKQIAQAVGYDDNAHFYRFFCSMSALTPKLYRRRYQLRG